MSNPICIECRTALNPGEPCDGGPRHHTTRLDTPDGREVLLREVWGPPGLRRQARQMAVAGGGGAATGTVLEGTCGALECAGSVGDVGPVVVILVLAAAGALIYILVAWIVRRIRKRRHTLKPNGALLCPLPPHGAHHPGTVVVGGPQIEAPSGQEAAAWSLSLRCKRFLRSDVMLRDGQCAGFTLRLEDGREVRVPPGRVRLDGPAPRAHSVPTAGVEAHLERLDPLRRAPGSDEDLDPIPFDRADELVLRPGDVAELRGTLEPMVLEGEEAGGYRGGASSVLVPVGAFALRLVR